MRVAKFQFQNFEQIDSVSLGAFQTLPDERAASGGELRNFEGMDAPEHAAMAAPPAPAMIRKSEAVQMQQEAHAAGRSEGYEQGLEAGKAEADARVKAAVTAHDQAVQGNLGIIGTQLAALFTAGQDKQQASIAQTAKLAMVMAKKVASHALTHHAAEAIELHIVSTLTNLHGEPEIVITVAQDMTAALQDMLDRLVREAGYRGTVIVEGDNTMHSGDCRITWNQGKAERIVDDLLDTIAEIVERYSTAEESAATAAAQAADATDSPIDHSPIDHSPIANSPKDSTG